MSAAPPASTSVQQNVPPVVQKLAAVNEQAWLTLGNLAEMMADWERAMSSYESALRHNPYSISALSHIASLCRGREQFGKAVEYFKRILAIQENNGETWSALGHCYLMMDNLQEAYHAYQQALYHLPNPKDPKLWYGIGILYDRYGSIEHAEEAFSAVMKMDPGFEKANEIYFRLGIIYKQQQKYDLSLQCFRYILHNPPRPLTESDIWFQTGHVYEQQKEYEYAKEAYERVLAENPDHAKVLQQLGWLYHQQNTSFTNQNMAVTYLTRSLKADSNDAQSWYLLGRCYMAEQNYNKAYEAYQQAVYRDARNPTFWCSIGVLYYQINQYRDALDAYSRAIRLNPYISEVWYDLGTLYESCNNQIQDALDAYQRAAELDPNNPHIRQRLELLRKTHGISASSSSNGAPAAPVTTPVPQDVNNPYQYAQHGPSAPVSNAGAQYPPPPLAGGHQGPPGAPHGPNGRPYETSSTPGSTGSSRRGAAGPPPPQTMEQWPPARDLPMPGAANGAPTADRRSPVPHAHPPAVREDVRIPDIGGGRVPTPGERVQMNPLMLDGAGRPAAHPPPPPSASQHGAPMAPPGPPGASATVSPSQQHVFTGPAQRTSTATKAVSSPLVEANPAATTRSPIPTSAAHHPASVSLASPTVSHGGREVRQMMPNARPPSRNSTTSGPSPRIPPQHAVYYGSPRTTYPYQENGQAQEGGRRPSSSTAYEQEKMVGKAAAGPEAYVPPPSSEPQLPPPAHHAYEPVRHEDEKRFPAPLSTKRLSDSVAPVRRAASPPPAPEYPMQQQEHARRASDPDDQQMARSRSNSGGHHHYAEQQQQQQMIGSSSSSSSGNNNNEERKMNDEYTTQSAAAGTLMSLAGQKGVVPEASTGSSNKRHLEMADEEDDSTDEKRPRLPSSPHHSHVMSTRMIVDNYESSASPSEPRSPNQQTTTTTAAAAPPPPPTSSDHPAAKTSASPALAENSNQATQPHLSPKQQQTVNVMTEDAENKQQQQQQQQQQAPTPN